MTNTATSKTVKSHSVKVVNARRISGEIVVEDNCRRLGMAIESGKIVVFRAAYPADEMIKLRKRVIEWAASTEEFPRGVSASKPGHNFHRIDDETTPSSIPHTFHQFGFGDLASLPPDLSNQVLRTNEELMNLQNRLARTNFASDDPNFRLKVIHYPKGGNHVAHTHPLLPQKVSLFLSLSDPGKDYISGGARFKVNSEWIEIIDHLRIGDIVAWRYDLIHEVVPIDVGDSLDWNSEDGLWIFSIERIETYQYSKIHYCEG